MPRRPLSHNSSQSHSLRPRLISSIHHSPVFTSRTLFSLSRTRTSWEMRAEIITLVVAAVSSWCEEILNNWWANRCRLIRLTNCIALPLITWEVLLSMRKIILALQAIRHKDHINRTRHSRKVALLSSMMFKNNNTPSWNRLMKAKNRILWSTAERGLI